MHDTGFKKAIQVTENHVVGKRTHDVA